jgi:hypothetical protein
MTSVAPSALHTLYFFYVGVGRTSVPPSALHTLFSSVTWWRVHKLSESGTDSYTEVMPAPQGGRVW